MSLPGFDTVDAAFSAAVRRWPDRPMLNVLAETAGRYGIPAGEIAYAEAGATVAALAARLTGAGYGAGHRLMLAFENRPAYFLWVLAANRIGAAVVPVNPDLRVAELAYMIGHAEPALAVGLPGPLRLIAEATREAGSAMPAVTPEDPLPPPANTGTAAPGQGLTREAALLYTSGTTGQPKGCILTNEYFLTAARWYRDAGGLCAIAEEPAERMITPLPVFHMNAFAVSFMAMLGVGGCLTVLDRFHPATWWQNVRDARATCLHYLGVMPSILMKAPPGPDDRAHSVRFGFGAGVDPKLHAAFEERFGLPLVEAWAMTETGCIATIAANHPPRRIGESCLGHPWHEVEIQIIDDSGADAGGAPGELLVRRKGDDPRKGFFAGYYKNPEATAEAWEGGWFHTGDIVRRDVDGSIFFVDRKKNVIRRSGENIAAVEVESALLQHSGVKAVAVAAVPDEMRGDEVFALIVPDPDSPATAEEIVAWCLTRLAYYKAPGYVAFAETLPLTATQKIQRGVLKTLCHDLLGDPATVDTRAMKKRTAA